MKTEKTAADFDHIKIVQCGAVFRIDLVEVNGERGALVENVPNVQEALDWAITMAQAGLALISPFVTVTQAKLPKDAVGGLPLRKARPFKIRAGETCFAVAQHLYDYGPPPSYLVQTAFAETREDALAMAEGFAAHVNGTFADMTKPLVPLASLIPGGRA